MKTIPAQPLPVLLEHGKPRNRALFWRCVAWLDALLCTRAVVYSTVPLPSNSKAFPLPHPNIRLHQRVTSSSSRVAPVRRGSYVGFGSNDVAHLSSLLPLVSPGEAFVPSQANTGHSPLSPPSLPLDTSGDAYSRFLAALTQPLSRPQTPTAYTSNV